MMLPGRAQRAQTSWWPYQAGDPALCHSDPLIQAGPGGSLSRYHTDPRSQGGRPRHIRPQAAKRRHRSQNAIWWGLNYPNVIPAHPLPQRRWREYDKALLMFRPPKGTPDGWGFEESPGAATCINNPKRLLTHRYISNPDHLLCTAPARNIR